MKRIELFEFEDFPNFPKWIRTSITQLIVVLHKMMGTTDLLASLISKIRERHNFSKIVDIGAGSGGAMHFVLEKINSKNGKALELLLTDLHPDPEIVAEFNAKNISGLHYSDQALNATDLAKAPEGLKTMMNSFHHMPVHIAKDILKSAQENKQPFLVYELTENTIPTLAWWLFLPISMVIMIIMVVFMTPFVRPLTFKQIFFTYLIPIIPICYGWDGQASAMRTYSKTDLEEMLAEIKSDDYSWEYSKALKENGKAQGYYLLGLPN